MSIQLRLNSIESFNDVRDALQKIKEAFDNATILNGQFQFYTITFKGAITNFKYSHNLPFTPMDVLQTSITGTGTVTWNYSLFSPSQLDLTSTGPCVVRAFIGRFKGN